jgi:hypothetical protein
LKLERELDGLYALPLEEFTAARNELARHLKREGDPRAGEVGRLAKPTVAVWTINQLARREPLAVRRLLGTGAALRKAQEQVLQGKGTAALAKAQVEQRDALRLLGERARSLLAESGRPASGATLERVASTLSAAAVDESARPLLKAGRIATELEPAGFGALAGMPAPALRAADHGAARRREQQEQKRRERELRERVRRLEREADDAERAAERAEADARNRREAAKVARAAADEAASRLQRGS